MGIILWLIIGGVIGWLASIIMRTDAQQGIFLNIVVGIATAGRPEILSQTLADLRRQSRIPDAVVVCAPSEADFGAARAHQQRHRLLARGPDVPDRAGMLGPGDAGFTAQASIPTSN